MRGERGEGGTDDRSTRGPDQDWGKDELGLAGWSCLVPGSWTATLQSSPLGLSSCPLQLGLACHYRVLTGTQQHETPPDNIVLKLALVSNHPPMLLQQTSHVSNSQIMASSLL